MTYSFETVFLSLGANLGDPAKAIASALEEIYDIPLTNLIQTSPLYQTKPISDLIQPDFLNCCCEIKTALSPEDLLEKLQEIERRLGKTPKPKNAPRLIDIDILFYGDLEMRSPRLTLPHPQWKNRLFVLIPLFDLTGNSEHQRLIENFSEEEKQDIKLAQNKLASSSCLSYGI
jgi:2-amino-4-hydroxy-6-hydroxymethyldihydropteridine diphosphokinase